MKRAFAIMAVGMGLLAAPAAGQAGEADVTAVAVRTGSTYTFNVTVRHADEGWDHYANSDKAWFTDLDNVEWETFFTFGASDAYPGDDDSERDLRMSIITHKDAAVCCDGGWRV